MSVVKKEVAQTTDSLQVCASQVAGVEWVNHSMVDLIYLRVMTQLQYSRSMLQMPLIALIITYFYNNIRVICPEISDLVINCYTLPSSLFARGKGELKSQEGPCKVILLQ